MGKIKDSILLYEDIRKYKYNISIENGMKIVLKFGRDNYHHLAGYQHLDDLPDISRPPQGPQKFYTELKKNRIKESYIESSERYYSIEERISAFSFLKEILDEGSGKIIVQFDPNKAESIIAAKFFLYKRVGDPFKGEVVYYTLFIDNNICGEPYFPVSYLVEHSAQYVREQVLLDCTISKEPLKKNKKQVPMLV